MENAEVLIIGAGPTGLVLALWLTKTGVKVRIIDKAEKAGTTSRALVIHPRTLEFYNQLGIATRMVERGVEIKGANLWISGERVGRLQFSNIHASISPFQFILGLPQDEQEEMLETELANLGVKVERSTELLSFEQSITGVRAQLIRTGGAAEQCEAQYLMGCDGARSVVRQQIGTDFPGGTYEETYYVADLKCKGLFELGEVNIAIDEADFLALFPLKGLDVIRLVGTIRHDATTKKELSWNDVSEGIIQRLKLEVQEVRWFSTYKVHHRVASFFHKGNVFLLGDAGHIHSPVGGQGMNTGIGDAVNLAWKIAAVIKDKAPLVLLDTYQPERIAFARRLVATTDTAFTFVSARGAFAKWVRLNVVPVLLPFLFGLEPVRRLMFRNISQIEIKYRQSALSGSSTGKIKAGDRLPWVKPQGGDDNFSTLNILKWQVHIYGEATGAMPQLCKQRGIKLSAFAWSEAAGKAGLKRNAVYVVRPDGYIGMAAVQNDEAKIEAYLDRWSVGHL